MFKEKKKSFSSYLILTVISILLSVFYFNDNPINNISIPWGFEGDGLTVLFNLKSSFDSPWYYWFYKSQNVGYPFETSLIYLPSGLDFSYYVICKILGIFLNNFEFKNIVILNIFVFLKFPITSLITYFVLNSLYHNKLLNICLSLIYSFTFASQMRGLGHVWIGAYFFLPLTIYLQYKIFHFYKTKKKSFFNNLNIKKKILYSFFIFLSLTGGFYYGYYFLVSIIFLYLYLFLNGEHYDIKDLAKIIVLSLFILFTVNIPNIIFTDNIYNRQLVEQDMWGLKISEMLLPFSSWPNSFLNSSRNLYLSSLVFTEPMNSIGTIPSILLAFSIIIFFSKLPKKKLIFFKHYNFDFSIYLCTLFFFIFLITTTGGLSFIQAIFFDQLRAHNRVSVYLLLIIISIFTLNFKFFFIQKKNLKKIIITIIVIIVSTISIYETKLYKNNFNPTERYKKEFLQNKIFFKNAFNNDDKILNYPIIPNYPEIPPINGVSIYEMLKPYLLTSSDAKFSFPTFKNTYENDYMIYLSQLDFDSQLEFDIDRLYNELINRGFTKIVVDKKFLNNEKNISFNSFNNKFKIIKKNDRYTIYEIIAKKLDYNLLFNKNSILPHSIQFYSKNPKLENLPTYINLEQILKKKNHGEILNLEEQMFNTFMFQKFDGKNLEPEHMKIDIYCKKYGNEDLFEIKIVNNSVKDIIFGEVNKTVLKLGSYYVDKTGSIIKRGNDILNQKIIVQKNSSRKIYSTITKNFHYISNKYDLIVEPIQEGYAWFSSLQPNNLKCKI
jgi:hypothetical protein